MKALWLVSFRPIGKSKINDFYQDMFIESIKSINKNIIFSLTQFNEENVKKFIDEKNVANFFSNVSKNELPKGKKYSNKIMLENALNQYLDDNDYEYLIYSTADIIVPNNLFEILSNIKDENFCALIFPNTHVINGVIKNNFWPHYGIDLIIFKISHDKAKLFKKIIKSWNQYDWGINENFYIAISEALNLKIHNLFKYCNVIKFENDFKTFVENRNWQINSWKENQKYLINFLKQNKLSQLYAFGSYYFLLFKIFRLKDLNFKLFLAYLIFYPFNLAKKIFHSLKKIFI